MGKKRRKWGLRGKVRGSHRRKSEIHNGLGGEVQRIIIFMSFMRVNTRKYKSN